MINIPGVYYPPHMLTEKMRQELHLPVILSKPPTWAISSRQVAAILGCKQSSTRELLHRERVRFCRVAVKGCPPMNVLVGRMFRNIYRPYPELPRKFLHDVNQDQLTDEILSSIKISRHRLQYSLLLEDFFSYAQRHGWVDKSE